MPCTSSCCMRRISWDIPDAISLAKERPEFVERGLALKKAGNHLMEQLGGRAIHPINVRLGGFYSVPRRNDLKPLAEVLRHALDDALYTVRSVAEFDFPEAEFDHEFLALSDPDRYPIENGTIERSAGPRVRDRRLQRPRRRGAGPAFHRPACHPGRRPLPDRPAGAVLAELGSALAGRAAGGGRGRSRARMPKPVPEHRRPCGRGGLRDRGGAAHHRRIRAAGARRSSTFRPVPASGHGVSEAPRGLLYHRYEIGDDGLVRAATIVPPTSQNQAAIEHEMAQLVAANLSLDDAALTSLCEKSIRNHDPCISCSAHFLTLTVDIVESLSNRHRQSSAATTGSASRWPTRSPSVAFPAFG